MLLTAVAALLSVAPQPANVVSIRAGEAITVEFDGPRAVLVSRAPAAPMNAYQRGLLRRLQIQASQLPPGVQFVPPERILRGEIEGSPPTAPANAIRITFRRVESLDRSKAGDSVLTIENGTGQKFHYRAVMHGNGRSAPTDVCEILPDKPGMEHWPYVIEFLELWELRLQPADDMTISCH